MVVVILCVCARRSEWTLNVVSWGAEDINEVLVLISESENCNMPILLTDFIYQHEAFSLLRAYCSHFLLDMCNFKCRWLNFATLKKGEALAPGPNFRAKLPKTHKPPPPPQKWRVEVFILKPLSNHLPKMLAIIIFNWWHQGHPVRASSHWTKFSSLVILFSLFNCARWWF